MRTYRTHIPVPALTEFADVNNMMLNNMIKLALARAFDYPDCKRTRLAPGEAEFCKPKTRLSTSEALATQRYPCLIGGRVYTKIPAAAMFFAPFSGILENFR